LPAWGTHTATAGHTRTCGKEHIAGVQPEQGCVRELGQGRNRGSGHGVPLSYRRDHVVRVGCRGYTAAQTPPPHTHETTPKASVPGVSTSTVHKQRAPALRRALHRPRAHPPTHARMHACTHAKRAHGHDGSHCRVRWRGVRGDTSRHTRGGPTPSTTRSITSTHKAHARHARMHAGTHAPTPKNSGASHIVVPSDTPPASKMVDTTPRNMISSVTGACVQSCCGGGGERGRTGPTQFHILQTARHACSHTHAHMHARVSAQHSHRHRHKYMAQTQVHGTDTGAWHRHRCMAQA
jgi:hypothetical protein